MSRVKLAIFGFIAALFVSALTSATGIAVGAEAETRYYVEGTELTSNETYEVGELPIYLNSTIAGAKLVIECKVENTGVIETEGKQTAALTFNSCATFEIKNGEKKPLPTCTTTQFDVELELRIERRLLVVPILVVRSRNRVWTEMLTGSLCAFKGTYEVTGASIAAIPEGYIEKREHSIVFTSTGSELKFGAEPAALTYVVPQIKLKSGKSWRIG